MSQHTLAVLVENSPGVLARVASLFARRAYNIDSLAVGPTENPDISRMTIVLNLEGHVLDQVMAQVYKLVNVIAVSEMPPTASVHRELLLVKVESTKKQDVFAVVESYGAKVVDEDEGAIMIEATGESAHIEGLLRSLTPLGIRELVQSGLVALEHGTAALSDRTLSAQGISTLHEISTQADYQN
ncbi:MAG: acetolactate synthase small subunit [Actinobacteria bacterium]|nr:acetolactate synthase small subunit [Actinomycetota bacterium]